MRATLQLPPSIVLIEAALMGLVEANRVLIRAGVVPPSPLDTSVRYKREDSGLEEWDVASNCVKKGTGDCEDLNGWECAGIIETGEDPSARVILLRTGPRTLHCVVQLSSGEIADVCPALGMRSRKQSLSVRGLPHLEVTGKYQTRPPWRKHQPRKYKSPTGAKRPPKKKAPLRETADREPHSDSFQAKDPTTEPMPPGTIPTSNVMPGQNEMPSPAPLEDDEEETDDEEDEL